MVNSTEWSKRSSGSTRASDLKSAWNVARGRFEITSTITLNCTTRIPLTNFNSDLLKERFELHNIDFVIRGARDTDIEFMNCSREEVLSIARSMI